MAKNRPAGESRGGGDCQSVRSALSSAAERPAGPASWVRVANQRRAVAVPPAGRPTDGSGGRSSRVVGRGNTGSVGAVGSEPALAGSLLAGWLCVCSSSWLYMSDTPFLKVLGMGWRHGLVAFA